ncbi:hypothetical protein EYF80_046912 [Liparis tanakae]|uniref:Uncharacterized protein n=1 Tax=Liparis tanakae TaxID=230148 RepID=A0A4Z2FP56_9TELE|nr:hypothetical protein EYF80_046912 [Liparis tanakae]
MSGEAPVEHWGVLPRDTGPRLLGIRRLGLLAMGQTIEEGPADPLPGGEPGRWNRTGLKGNIRHIRKFSFFGHAAGGVRVHDDLHHDELRAPEAPSVLSSLRRHKAAACVLLVCSELCLTFA